MTRRASMKHGWIAIALSCGACAASNETATPTRSAEMPVVKSQPAASASARPASPNRPAAVASGVSGIGGVTAPDADAAGPTIPAGARFTIFCESITTEDHVARATALKEVLMKNARAHDWYVIHQEGRSSIYLGYYKEFEEAAAGKDAAALADAKRAKSDKQIVDAIPNPRDPARKLFPRAQFTQLDAPDPDAPPLWNLTNAPGYWSVQIAAYNGPDRKQNAVETVRQARAMNIEAYYYHGESTSSICVGHWPAEALKRQGTANVESARDDNETIVVNMTPNELTPEERRDMAMHGGNVKELRMKVEILDESLKATLKQYPIHAVNSEDQLVAGNDRKTGAKVMRPVPSFIVRIPNGAVMARAPRRDDSDAPTQSAPREPSRPAQVDLNSRLRGIGQ